jgi:hypothetical protein
MAHATRQFPPISKNGDCGPNVSQTEWQTDDEKRRFNYFKNSQQRTTAVSLASCVFC